MTVLQLGNDESAPRKARAAVYDLLADLPHEIQEVTALLASEVVTNALVHSTGPLDLRIEESAGEVTVEVSNPSPAAPDLRAAAPGDRRGRGMQLVEALASFWGVTQRPQGEAVWFRLAATGGAPPPIG